MFRDMRAGVVVAAVGALLGLVVSLAVTSPASALDDQAAGGSDVPTAAATDSVHVLAAEMAEQATPRGYPGVHTLVVTTEVFGLRAPWDETLVRVNCSNNFDGHATNNTTPGPGSDPLSPSAPVLVDGYVYLTFGLDKPTTQQVVVPDWAVCVVQQSADGGGVHRVEYEATADDPDTVVEIVQPPPGLGSVRVLWSPTGATDPAGETARVTITNRYTPCPTGEPQCDGCCVFGPTSTNTVRIKARIRGDAPDQPTFTLRLRCSGGGIMNERLLTFSDQTALDVYVPASRTRCVVKEIDTGGADRVEYFARSATADTSFGPNSARVDFGTDYGGGDSALLRVTNSYGGS